MSAKKELPEEFLLSFRNRKSAEKNLKRLADYSVGEDSFVNVRNMFKDIPDPDQALNILIRFIESDNFTDLGVDIETVPNIDHLIKIFGHSEYFSSVVMRNSDMLSEFILNDKIQKDFIALPTKNYFIPTSHVTLTDTLHLLRLYKEKSYFHIGVRNILEFSNLETTISDLSEL